MSLEELLSVNVSTGTLTGIETIKTPFSLTTVDSNDIQMTPSRTLLDLLEAQVPGAVFTNHWLGPRIGIRGVMGDQNNSFLLLVNGVNSNMRSNFGVTYEIQNKDLNDIDRIEFISGPGSAVYGPGAIGGVINIITKNAETAPGFQVYLEGNEHYRYGTIGASYGYRKNTLQAFLYASVTRSEGASDPQFFYIDRAHGYGYGYMGFDWGNKGLGTPAPKIYADYWDRPEYKLQFELKWADEWTFRSRLTTYNYIALAQESRVLNGLDSGGIFGKMFSASLENQHQFSDDLQIKTLLSFTSQSNRQVTFYRGSQEVADHITQRQSSFSENRITLRSALNYTFSDHAKLALGGEYSYEYYSPEWGMNDEDFILSFPAPIRFAVKNEDSGFHKQYGSAGFTTIIPDSIDGSMLSFFGELNYDINTDLKLLISTRSDKHSYSDWITSPRAALIWDLNFKNSIKIISQRSLRLPNFTDLYAEHSMKDSAVESEIMEGFEITFSHQSSKTLNFSTTIYNNSVNQIAWHQYEEDEKSGNAALGVFETIGLESILTYRGDKDTLALSYSFMQQLTWEPVKSINAWITGLNGALYQLREYAENRTNNFPEQMIKLNYYRQLTDDLKLHLDARVALHYQQNAMLDSFTDAHQRYGNQETIQEWNAILKALEDGGYGKNSFTSNVSLDWRLPLEKSQINLSLFVRNLIAFNHVRYVYQYWEPGNNRQYPRHSGFIKEPRTIGVRMQIQF